MRLAQHPKRPDEIFAALEINGVMRTTDGGETWKDCSDGLIRLAEQPHLKSKIVSDTTAEGMLDGHAIAISPADPDAADRRAAHGPVPHRRRRQDLAGHGDRPLLADHLRPRHQGLAGRAQHALRGAVASPPSSQDGAVYRSQDDGKTWQRFDKVQVHGTIMSVGLHHSDPNQVYIGARYDGEVFGTQDGGKTWQAMPLPGEVQHIYSVACG